RDRHRDPRRRAPHRVPAGRSRSALGRDLFPAGETRPAARHVDGGVLQGDPGDRRRVEDATARAAVSSRGLRGSMIRARGRRPWFAAALCAGALVVRCAASSPAVAGVEPFELRPGSTPADLPAGCRLVQAWPSGDWSELDLYGTYEPFRK